MPFSFRAKIRDAISVFGLPRQKMRLCDRATFDLRRLAITGMQTLPRFQLRFKYFSSAMLQDAISCRKFTYWSPAQSCLSQQSQSAALITLPSFPLFSSLLLPPPHVLQATFGFSCRSARVFSPQIRPMGDGILRRGFADMADGSGKRH